MGMWSVTLSLLVAAGLLAADAQDDCQCVDLVPPGLQVWENEEGITCDRYGQLMAYIDVETATYCELFADDRYHGYTMNEACCLCGGGDHPCDDIDPPSISPSVTPSVSALPPGCQCVDVAAAGQTDWIDSDDGTCESYESLYQMLSQGGFGEITQASYCTVFHDVVGLGGITYGTGCCLCGGGQTACNMTESPSPSPYPSNSPRPADGCTCTDKVPLGMPEWSDAQGLSCDQYEDLARFLEINTAAYCALYDDLSHGHTFGDACCMCGGGDWLCTPSPSGSPAPSATATRSMAPSASGTVAPSASDSPRATETVLVGGSQRTEDASSSSSSQQTAAAAAGAAVGSAAMVGVVGILFLRRKKTSRSRIRLTEKQMGSSGGGGGRHGDPDNHYGL